MCSFKQMDRSIKGLVITLKALSVRIVLCNVKAQLYGPVNDIYVRSSAGKIDYTFFRAQLSNGIENICDQLTIRLC